MPRLRRFDLSIWSHHLFLLAASVFMINFGQGLFRGASTNFLVDTLGLDGKQVMWQAGIREIPGLALMFIAALFMRLPLSQRSAAAVLVMGVGYGLFATVHSYAALLVMAVASSVGFHYWMPLQSTLAMSLTTKENSGRVMGSLSAVRALSAIVGTGAVAGSAAILPSLSLRAYYVVGGALIAAAAILILRLPSHLGRASAAERRLLLKREYWLYYVLTFFEGSRMQVFGTFGTLVLVENYGLDVSQISLILLVSGIINFVLSPMLGDMIDRHGERLTLSISYVLLALCFVGYATVHNAWMLAALLVAINLLVLLSMGLTTYVNRMAPRDELTPTLSAGVSINHITSVAMSLVAGTLLSIVGYEWLCWGAATIIMLSVPFALAIRVHPTLVVSPQPAVAE